MKRPTRLDPAASRRKKQAQARAGRLAERTETSIVERARTYLDRVRERSPRAARAADAVRQAVLGPIGIRALLGLAHRSVEPERILKLLVIAWDEHSWRERLRQTMAPRHRAWLETRRSAIVGTQLLLREPAKWPCEPGDILGLPGLEPSDVADDGEVIFGSRLDSMYPGPLGDLLRRDFDEAGMSVPDDDDGVIIEVVRRSAMTLLDWLRDGIDAGARAPKLGTWGLWGEKRPPPRKIVAAMAAFVLVGVVDPAALVPPERRHRRPDAGKAEIARLLGLLFGDTLPKGFRDSESRRRSAALAGLLSKQYLKLLMAPFRAHSPLGRLVRATAARIAVPGETRARAVP